MLRTLAMVFGIVFLIAGVLGFVPETSRHGYLLGTFRIDMLANIIHLATGVFGLMCGFKSPVAAKAYFQVFGGVYAILALLGFVYGERAIFGLLANNMANTWAHAVLGIGGLYLGFFCKD